MDNLKLRRLLAMLGFIFLTAAVLATTYGIIRFNNGIMFLGLGCFVIAYIISRQVRQLRLINEGKGKV
jgi:hypothetical protein